MTEKTEVVDLIDKAGRAAVLVADERENAREASVKGCRALERALRHCLEGEPLRGLANLGTSRSPFYAARVRGNHDERLTAPPSDHHTGPFAVCVDAHGCLRMAQIRGDGRARETWYTIAVDEDLLADDIYSLVACLAVVLPRHIEACKATGAKYRRLETLGAALGNLLDASERGEL